MTRQLTEPHQNSPLATFCIFLSPLKNINRLHPFSLLKNAHARAHIKKIMELEGDFRQESMSVTPPIIDDRK